MLFSFVKNKYFIIGFLLGIVFIQSFYPMYNNSRGIYEKCFSSLPEVCVYSNTGEIVNFSNRRSEPCIGITLNQEICDKGSVGMHKAIYKALHPIKTNFVDAILFFAYIFSFVWLLPESKILLTYIFTSVVFGLVGGIIGMLIYYFTKILKKK